MAYPGLWLFGAALVGTWLGGWLAVGLESAGSDDAVAAVGYLSSARWAAVVALLVGLSVWGWGVWRGRRGRGGMALAALVGVATLAAASALALGGGSALGSDLGSDCSLHHPGAFRFEVHGAVGRRPDQSQTSVVRLLARACDGFWVPQTGLVQLRVPSRHGRSAAGQVRQPLRMARGDVMQARLRLAPFSQRHNPTDFDSAGWAARQDLLAAGTVLSPLALLRRSAGLGLLDGARHAVAQRLEQQPGWSPEVRGLAKALATGDRGSVPPELRERWAVAGLSHLLAISGLHVGMVAVGVFGALCWGLSLLPLAAERFSVRPWAALMTLPLVGLFCWVTGASVSALRAGLMAGFALLGWVFGARQAGLNGLGLAGLVLLAWTPHVLWTVSFQLSFAAALGLCLCAPGLSNWEQGQLPEREGGSVGSAWLGLVWLRVWRVVRSGAHVSWVATVATSAPLVFHFGTLSWLGIGVNVVAVPIATMLATPLTLALAWLPQVLPSFGWASGGLGGVFEWLERGCAWLAGGGLRTLDALAVRAAAVPGADGLDVAEVYRPAWAWCALIFSVWWLGSDRRLRGKAVRWALVALVCGAAWLLPWRGVVAAWGGWRSPSVSGAPVVAAPADADDAESSWDWVADPAGWRVWQWGRLVLTFAYVGQGDGAIVQFPDGRVMVVDGGGAAARGRFDPGARVMVPMLRRLGIDEIDVMVATHPHQDHVGGLVAVAREFPVRSLWTSGAPTGLWSQLELERLVRDGGGRVLRGSDLPVRMWLGGVRLRVLSSHSGVVRRGLARGADEAEQADHELGAKGAVPWSNWHTNDRSVAVRLQYGTRSAWLSGDIEKAAEAWLAPWLRPVDILKVPHHGSKTSSTALLLQALQPDLAIISCGVRNRFGFPSASVMKRYQEFGATVLRTDVLGALQSYTDGSSRWRVRSMRGRLGE